MSSRYCHIMLIDGKCHITLTDGKRLSWQWVTPFLGRTSNEWISQAEHQQAIKQVCMHSLLPPLAMNVIWVALWSSHLDTLRHLCFGLKFCLVKTNNACWEKNIIYSTCFFSEIVANWIIQLPTSPVFFLSSSSSNYCMKVKWFCSHFFLFYVILLIFHLTFIVFIFLKIICSIYLRNLFSQIDCSYSKLLLNIHHVLVFMFNFFLSYCSFLLYHFK